MKIVKDSKYKSIISKVKRMGQVLDSDNPAEEDIHDVVVDFVSVLEYHIKKRLFAKNKVLIYELNSIDADDIKHILKGTIKDRNTVGALDAFNRYKLFYPNSKIVKQTKGIEILIRNRNELIHGIGIQNVQTKDDLIAILGAVFPDLIADVKSTLGTLPTVKVNKEKIYTEKDIQKVYEDILLSKINNYNNQNSALLTAGFANHQNSVLASEFITATAMSDLQSASESYLSFGKEYCPRCLKRTLSRTNDIVRLSFLAREKPDLYICSKCNLELTPTEYEMVKKLQREGKIKEKIGYYSTL